jgi:hypothetical protein
MTEAVCPTQVWEAETGRLVCTPYSVRAHNDTSTLGSLLVYSHRGGDGMVEQARVVVAVTHEPRLESVRVCDAMSGDEVSTFGTTSPTTCLTAFVPAPGTTRVLLGQRDGAVVVIDPEQGVRVATLSPSLPLGQGARPISAVHILTTQGRTQLATVLQGGGLRLWDLGEAVLPEEDGVVMRAANKRG